jgi:hypothetical protein
LFKSIFRRSISINFLLAFSIFKFFINEDFLINANNTNYRTFIEFYTITLIHSIFKDWQQCLLFVIHQWKDSIWKINSSIKCVMHVISSNALLQMIKSKCKIWKILIAFADDFLWIRRCIFEIAHSSHWTIFETFFLNYFNFINLFKLINHFWSTVL